jgi:nucleolar protein 56
MRAILFICEGGLALVDESFQPLASRRFSSDPVYAAEKMLNGESTQEFVALLDEAKRKNVDTILVHDQKLFPPIIDSGFAVKLMEPTLLASLHRERLSLIVRSGFASDTESARQLVQSFAVQRALRRLVEYAGRPDRHVAQAVSCVEELDRINNLIWGRLREWYSLHFPELASLVTDANMYSQMVLQFGRRELFTPEALSRLAISEAKSRAIIQASRESKGADLRDEDLAQISRLAETYLHLDAMRKRMSEHVSKTMQIIAPNLTSVVGPLVGAKLIARAGGLDKLASLPSSTIQLLGAEKALFRSLRTGTKPPKHGILFQHPLVHGSPRWQRGKIARVLANAVAIAARIDLYRGELDATLPQKLERRVAEIKAKYASPPSKPEKRAKGRGKKSRGA